MLAVMGGRGIARVGFLLEISFLSETHWVPKLKPLPAAFPRSQPIVTEIRY